MLEYSDRADSFFGDDEGATLGAGDLKESYAENEGEMVGPYKLLQEIGQGGFGSVWMAEQSKPISRKVALKVIKMGMDTREVIARFEAERQALAMMDHPNIAKVLDAGATDRGRPFFVMELVKGIPITDYCDQAGLDIRKQSDKHPGTTEEELRAIAVDILQKLAEGGDFAELAEQHSEGWAEGKTETVAYGDLPEHLSVAAFSLEEGGFTRKLIEDEHAFYLLRVESRQAVKAEAFDDPKAQEAIKALLAAQSRGDWERRYLARLQDKKPDPVMARMQNMAATYLMLAGDFSNAEKLLEQVFALRLAELGAEAPKTLDTMGNLAVCRLRLGRWEEGLKMSEELLALRRKVLGPEHPDTLMAMGNLGIFLFQVGRRDDAIQMQEKVLTLTRKVFGPEHSQTLVAMSALGIYYSEVGRQEDVLKLKEEFEATQSKVNGQRQDPKPAAPTTLPAPTPGSAVAALKDAALQAWFGKDAEHDATRRRVLAGAAATTNADVAERVAKLACLRPIADAKTQEATLTLARRALELARKSGEPGPWQQMTLGMAEYRSGRFQEADAALNAVAGMMNPKTYRPGVIQGTADFYRAMSLFQLDRQDEARALVTATEAKMKPFPADEKNPLAQVDHDDLILWLAYKEAQALLKSTDDPAPDGAKQ